MERHTGGGQHHIQLERDVPRTPTSTSQDSRYVSLDAGAFFAEAMEQECGAGEPGDPVGKKIIFPPHSSPIFADLQRRFSDLAMFAGHTPAER